MKAQIISLRNYLGSPEFAARRQALRLCIERGNRLLDRLHCADFLPLLLIRLYLVPVFWMGAINKFASFQATADWFGGSLGLPLPYVMVFLAASAELFGAILLLV